MPSWRSVVTSSYRSSFALFALLLAAGCTTPNYQPCDGNAQCPENFVCDANLLCVPGGNACIMDSDCTAPTPRCSPGTGRCVPCLLGAGDCPAGKVCVSQNGSTGCTPACSIKDDCAA